MALINGTPGDDELSGNPNENDNVFGDAGNDTIAIGETNPALFDFAAGGDGADTITITGLGEAQGGPGADRLVADPVAGSDDNSAFSNYLDAPAGISANLTGTSQFGLAGGDTAGGFQVADGFGSVDLVFGINFFQASDHDDQIWVDSTYLTDFGNWIEVRPNGGNDTVVFDGVATARVSYFRSGGPVRADMQAGTATDRHDGDSFIENDTFTGANEFRGTAHDDEIFGAEGADVRLRGAGGNDYIDGRAGDDRLEGEDGDDVLHGGAGADRLDGGAGMDRADYSGSAAAITVDFTAGTATGDAAADTFIAIEGVIGTDFADTLTGGNGNYWLVGGGGNDVLHNGSTETATEWNILEGGAGDDSITIAGLGAGFGGAGADRITGIAVSTGPTDERDFVEAVHFDSPAGIVVNFTDATKGGLAGGSGEAGYRIADGHGSVDIVSGIHTVGDTGFDDQFFVDSSYQTSFGNWIEIKLSGGDDTVEFDGVAVAGVSYAQANGAVRIDLAAGTATDLDPLANAIGNDSFLGANRARGSSFDDELYGSGGADQLRGRNGNDFLSGGAGDDLLYGDERAASEFGGHDMLAGGAGADQLIGGAGTDFADYSASATAVTVDIKAGTASGGDAEGDTFASIEGVRGSALDDVLTAGAAVNNWHLLEGGAGNDTLTIVGLGAVLGGAGNDRIVGVSSGDVDNGDFVEAAYWDAAAGIVVNLTASTQGGLAGGDNEAGFSVQDGGGGTDKVSGIHVISDTVFNDSFYVDGSFQNSFGNWIELNLSAGDDTVVFDSVDVAGVNYANAAGAVVVDLAAGTATDRDPMAAAIGNDTFLGANRARGTFFDDELRGSSGDDQLRGRQGNDLLTGGDGNDVLFGDERLSFPLGGNDFLDGGQGSDTLSGGLGSDIALFEGASTDYSYEVFGAGLRVTELVAGANGVIDTDQLASVETLRFSDGDFAASGFVTITLPTEGDDVIEVEGDEGVTIDAGEGNDTMVGGGGDDVLTGGTGNDDITAGDGDDEVYAGDGDDRVVAASGRGTDLYDGGSGFDHISFSSSSQGVVIDLIAGIASGIEIGDDVIRNFERVNGGSGRDSIVGGLLGEFLDGGAGDDAMAGGGGVDTLIGGAGNETLDGGDGFDFMLGGEGDDTYLVNDTFDLVDEGYIADFAAYGFGGVNDTIRSTANWFWDVYGIAETLQIEEGASDPDGTGTTLVGGVFDNVIVGNSGTNVLFGRGGDDTYRAGDGVDFISLSLLGVPEDLYDGVNGVNTIVVEKRVTGDFSYDVVFEFESGKDKLDVSDYGFASAEAAFATGVDDGAGNSYFILGDDGLDYLYMVGLTLDELSAGDFIV